MATARVRRRDGPPGPASYGPPRAHSRARASTREQSIYYKCYRSDYQSTIPPPKTRILCAARRLAAPRLTARTLRQIHTHTYNSAARCLPDAHTVRTLVGNVSGHQLKEGSHRATVTARRRRRRRRRTRYMEQGRGYGGRRQHPAQQTNQLSLSLSSRSLLQSLGADLWGRARLRRSGTPPEVGAAAAQWTQLTHYEPLRTRSVCEVCWSAARHAGWPPSIQSGSICLSVCGVEVRVVEEARRSRSHALTSSGVFDLSLTSAHFCI